MLIFCALTWTPLAAHEPPPLGQLIPGWIATPLVLAAIAYAIDRKRVRG
jgi:hypothetical protein